MIEHNSTVHGRLIIKSNLRLATYKMRGLNSDRPLLETLLNNYNDIVAIQKH